MNLEILVVADNFALDSGFLNILEAQGHRVSGTFTPERTWNFLKTTYLWIPDLILAFTNVNFQKTLDLAKWIWELRVSRNFATRPLMLTMARNKRLSDYQLIFERAGSRLAFMTDPQALLHEIKRVQSTLAELSIGKPHCIQIHENRNATPLCSPGDRCTTLLLAADSATLGEIHAADRLRTFTAALMTMNGKFFSRREIQRRLRMHPLYKSSQSEVPNIGTIKTYLTQDCPEIFEKTLDRLKLGYAPAKLVEKDARPGNEMGYRLKFSWEIRHIQSSVCLTSY